jgi:hypothetical protein
MENQNYKITMEIITNTKVRKIVHSILSTGRNMLVLVVQLAKLILFLKNALITKGWFILLQKLINYVLFTQEKSRNIMILRFYNMLQNII